MPGRRSSDFPRRPCRRRVLALAVAPLFAAAAASPSLANVIIRNVKPGPGAGAPASAAPSPLTAAADSSIAAYPIAINGFQPFVVMGLTDENDNEFYSPKAAEPGSLFRPPPNQTQLMSPQPFNPAPHPPRYIVGTLDSGGQATIVSYADTQTINLFQNGLEGTYQVEVSGAGE